MAIEAISLTNPQPHELGLTPQLSNLPQIETPEHLTRRFLRKKAQIEGKPPEDGWGKRAQFVENKVLDSIASQTNIVLDVQSNSRDDADGPDLHVFFVSGFPIGDVWIEVKSSTRTLGMYKEKIRDSLPEKKRNMDEAHKWMTDHRIILINGGESYGTEKTPQEIISDSFLPQLKRIIENERMKGGENNVRITNS